MLVLLEEGEPGKQGPGEGAGLQGALEPERHRGPGPTGAGGVLLSVSGEVSGGGTSRPEAVNQGEKAASS